MSHGTKRMSSTTRSSRIVGSGPASLEPPADCWRLGGRYSRKPLDRVRYCTYVHASWLVKAQRCWCNGDEDTRACKRGRRFEDFVERLPRGLSDECSGALVEYLEKSLGRVID